MMQRYEKLSRVPSAVHPSHTCAALAHDKLHEYEPLSSSTSMRLICLRAGTLDAPISCTMTAHPIESHPQYEALSYCWGDSVNSVSILCAGRMIHVTQNLWHAMRRLRQPDQERILWIDALCINQQDIHERATQVGLMKEIYSQATAIVIWLGEGNETSECGIKLIRHIGENISESSNDIWCTHGPLPNPDWAATGLPASDSPDWKALEALYWRAWFSRVWVIQELATARSAVVICGADSLNWEYFAVTSRWLATRHISALVRPTIDAQNGVLLDEYRRTDVEHTLLNLLNRSRNSMASDPRDNVYALLGISSDFGPLDLVADYSKSAVEVFRDTALLYFQRGSLDILSSIGDYRWSSRLVGRLPSWVPDWSSRTHAVPFLTQLRIEPHMHAGGMGKVQLQFSEDLSVMYSTGVIFDHVRKAGPVHYVPRIEGRNVVAARLNQFYRYQIVWVLRHWERIAVHLKRYPTGESHLNAFQRTLIANASLEESRVPQSLDTYYNAFRLSYLSTNVPEFVKPDTAAATVYGRAVSNAAVDRRFFVTRKGYMGLGSHSTRPGDIIAVLSGGKTPYVLRKSGRALHRFLGECYVHGIMDGEALEELGQLMEIAIA